MGGAFDNPRPADVQTRSTIGGGQEQLLNAVSNFLTPRVGKGATPIPFESITELPQLLSDAFAQFEESFRGEGQDIRTRLEGLLDPSRTFQADVPGVKDRFTRDVLNPAAQAIRDTLGETVFNELNQPGRFFATDVPENVGRAISTQLGLTTVPLLASSLEAERGREFTSQEAFRAREPGLVAGLQQLPITQFQQAFSAATGFQGAQQDILNRRVAEFLRLTPEQDPFLQLALGFPLTAQTQQSLIRPAKEAGQGQQIGLDLLGMFAGQGLNLTPTPTQQTGVAKP